jgi:hypothetical protein
MVLVERSTAMDEYSSALRDALVEVGSSLGEGGSLGLILAGPSPELSARPARMPDLAAMARSLKGPSARAGRFDLGLRLAVNTLMPDEARDSILYFSSGVIDSASFQGASVSELGALLVNNGIRLHLALFGEGRVDPSLEYLVHLTGGSIISASRPRGLRDLPLALSGSPTGRYEFSFLSADSSELGNRQLSVAVEAYLYQKSGRDELGYYAPLQ